MEETLLIANFDQAAEKRILDTLSYDHQINNNNLRNSLSYIKKIVNTPDAYRSYYQQLTPLELAILDFIGKNLTVLEYQAYKYILLNQDFYGKIHQSQFVKLLKKLFGIGLIERKSYFDENKKKKYAYLLTARGHDFEKYILNHNYIDPTVLLHMKNEFYVQCWQAVDLQMALEQQPFYLNSQIVIKNNHPLLHCLLAAGEETLYDCSIYFWLHDFNNNIQNRLNHLPVTNLEKHSLSYATTFTKIIPLTLISVNDINTLKELKERLKDNGHYGIVILSLIDNGKNGETDNKDKKGILRSIIVKNNGKINWLKFRQISDEK